MLCAVLDKAAGHTVTRESGHERRHVTVDGEERKAIQKEVFVAVMLRLMKEGLGGEVQCKCSKCQNLNRRLAYTSNGPGERCMKIID